MGGLLCGLTQANSLRACAQSRKFFNFKPLRVKRVQQQGWPAIGRNVRWQTLIRLATKKSAAAPPNCGQLSLRVIGGLNACTTPALAKLAAAPHAGRAKNSASRAGNAGAAKASVWHAAQLVQAAQSGSNAVTQWSSR